MCAECRYHQTTFEQVIQKTPRLSDLLFFCGAAIVSTPKPPISARSQPGPTRGSSCMQGASLNTHWHVLLRLKFTRHAGTHTQAHAIPICRHPVWTHTGTHYCSLCFGSLLKQEERLFMNTACMGHFLVWPEEIYRCLICLTLHEESKV